MHSIRRAPTLVPSPVRTSYIVRGKTQHGTLVAIKYGINEYEYTVRLPNGNYRRLHTGEIEDDT